MSSYLLFLSLLLSITTAKLQNDGDVSRTGGPSLKPGYDLMKRPKRGGLPDLVQIGVRVRRVLEIDTVATTATVDLIMSLEWTDARLIGVVPRGSPPLRVTRDQIWTPGIILMNAAAETTKMYEGFHLSWNGKVKGLQKALHVADVHIDVSMFPFDRNRCEFVFDAPDYGSKEVTFAANQDFSVVDVDEDTVYKILNWNVTRSVKLSPYDGQQNDYIVGMLDIARIPSMIVVELVVPLTLIVMFAMLGLYTQSSDTRIAITTTAFLTTMAFIYVVDEQLPKIAYSTWMHVYMLLCFVFVFLTMIVVVIADALGEGHSEEDEGNDIGSGKPLLPSTSAKSALKATTASKATTRSMTCCFGTLTKRESCFFGLVTRKHAINLYHVSKIGMPLLFTFCVCVMTISMSVSAQTRMHELIQRESELTIAGSR
jgi:hypothetical protein